MTTNLPLQLTSFIGREREIAEVKRLLTTTRLLTLTGAGGAGKTRLTLQVASELIEQYANGAWFVDLAPLTNPALVPQAIAFVFDLHESTDSSLSAILTNYLRPKNLLLVLDNCEHLIEACAQVVDTFLRAGPNLVILATSRQVLGIAGETTFRVPSLALPNLQNESIETLAKSEAIRLFMERATAAHHEFKLTNQNASSIAQICQRLDGMPLAIELAAARVRSLSVEQIALRLDDRFRLLTLGSRTAPTRQQTLREAIEWSYHLLTEQEQALWRRLSVFAGGWTLEAAEQICSGDGLASSEILDLLAHLVDKSIVIARNDVARYHLLETIRQYGHEKLLESTEAEMIHQCHLAWLVQFAKAADPKLRSKEMNIWARRLDDELDNIRAALEWAFEHGSSSDGARLVAALHYYIMLRGIYPEAKRWAEKAERLTRDAPPDVYAEALFVLGYIFVSLSDAKSAEPVMQQALVRYRTLGNLERVAYVLNLLGAIIDFRAERAQAEQYLQEALTIRRAIGDTWGITHTLQNFGGIAEYEGDYVTAKAIYEEGLTLSQELGDERMIARLLADLGDVAYAQGDLKQADALLRRAVSALWHMGEKFSLFQKLRRYVRIMVAEGKSYRAAQLIGAIEFARAELGMQDTKNESKDLAETMSRIRDLLGEDGLTRAFGEGRTMKLDEAIEFALVEPVPESMVLIAPHDPSALTRREVEVLRLVADGLSDAQIAEKLVISVRTVNTHLSSIYSKLGVKSRSAATRNALERKLV